MKDKFIFYAFVSACLVVNLLGSFILLRIMHYNPLLTWLIHNA